jgi:tetratricopeptide (TPR) repeat protein
MSRFLCAIYSPFAPWILALVSLSSPLVLRGQNAQTQTESAMAAIVQGVVRDAGGHPVAGATVSLQGKDTGTLTARTDLAGAYRFSVVRQGVYTLRAEVIGYIRATVESFTIARSESKTIDLALESAKASAPQNSYAEAPQFFDEPHFTVAGVTDTTNLGGHGSDTVVRNRDALARDTAALSKSPSATLSIVSADPAREKSLRKAVERQPSDFKANYQLGKLLVDEGKPGDALVYLQSASRLEPHDHDNQYELALARANSGDYEHARVDLLALLSTPNEPGQKTAEYHHLLAEVCEKLNDPLKGVKDYQLAAELDPSELYFFDWGAELLLHHAAEPAVEVFTKGNRLFPRSARMLAGLGASWYALGSYDKAVQRLGEASDLNPDDPDPYLFMGKMQAVETAPSEAITERLERFVRLQPENPFANYYYAVSVWRQRKSPQDMENFAQVKSLLEKAVQLDPALGLGYLQLGVLYSERKDFPNAVATYQRALAATPQLEEAHYRLAQAYRQTGELAKAQAELQLYEKISNEKAAEIERQRHEVQQFVYQLRDGGMDTKPR